MALISGKFHLLATPGVRGGAKRVAEAVEQELGRSAKVPRANEVTTMATPTKSTQRRLPTSAPMDICIYHYCDQASILWDLLQEKDEFKLYQVQLSHEVQRSATFSMRDSFNEFLTKAHEENESVPMNLQELEKEAAVKLVVTDRTDPDNIGFKQWRVAFYCVDLSNFLLLLDGWLKHKEKQMALEKPLQVTLHPHNSVDDGVDMDTLDYEYYTLHEPSRDLPLHIFDAQPVIGKRITVLNIQLCSDSVFDLVITGHTWPFRAALDSFNIHGGYRDDEESKEKRQYVRVWKEIDTSNRDVCNRFHEMLDTVFKKLCLRVVLDRAPTPNTDIAIFVEKLRENNSLFFTALDGMM